MKEKIIELKKKNYKEVLKKKIEGAIKKTKNKTQRNQILALQKSVIKKCNKGV